MTPACNADLGHRCDANDGEPCARCAEYERASYADAIREWRAMSPEERRRACMSIADHIASVLHELREAGRI